jgi:hypothetical protein
MLGEGSWKQGVEWSGSVDGWIHMHMQICTHTRQEDRGKVMSLCPFALMVKAGYAR